MIVDKLSRRMFLQGAGGALVGIPLLGSLLASREAWAAGAPARRFIAVYSGHGHPFEYWYPRSTVARGFEDAAPVAPGQAAFAMSRIAPNVRAAALDAVVAASDGRFSDILDEQLAGILRHLLIARGYDGGTGHGDHHKGHFLSGDFGRWSDFGPFFETIDQIMARSPKVYAAEPAFRSLTFHPGLAFFHTDTVSYARRDGAVQPVPSYTQCDVAYDSIFESVAKSGDGGASEQRRKQKLSLIDAVNGDLKAILASPRLSKDDRQRLEAHAQYLREYETKARTLKLIKCDAPGCVLPDRRTDKADGAFDGATGQMSEAEAAWSDNQIEIMAVAIKLGLTRVGALCLDNEQGTHGISHSRVESASASERERLMDYSVQWGKEMTRRFAKLVRLLDVEEPGTGGRTYLDNTLVYWGSCMSTVSNHDSRDLPVVLAGAKGFLAQNRYVDYRDAAAAFKLGMVLDSDGSSRPHPDKRTHYYGRPYNELLIACMLWMGVDPAEWEAGRAGYGPYDLWTAADRVKPLSEFGDQRSPSPGLTVVA